MKRQLKAEPILNDDNSDWSTVQGKKKKKVKLRSLKIMKI